MEYYCSSAKHSRSLVWWKDTLWEAVRSTISWPSDSVWSDGRKSAYFCSRLVATASVRSKSLARYIPWICVARGENLERRHLGRRYWGIGRDGRIWNLREKTRCKGSVNAHEWWKIIFSVADGTVKLSESDQVLRTSTLIRDSPDRGEEQGNLQGESDGSSSTPHRDSSWYDGDARNDFWSISGNFILRHPVEPRVKLYVPREDAFPISLKYINVTRATNILKITGAKMKIENCQVRGQVLQDSPFSMKNHLMEKHGPGRDWQENEQPPYQTLGGQRFGKICPMRRNSKKSEAGLSKNRSSTMPEDCVVFTSLILMM